MHLSGAIPAASSSSARSSRGSAPALVLHGHWTGRRLCLWGESPQRLLGQQDQPPADDRHPFASNACDLSKTLLALGLVCGDATDGSESITLRLPARNGRPLPGDRLGSALAVARDRVDPALSVTRIEAVAIRPARTIETLLQLESGSDPVDLECGHSLHYWFAVAGFALDLLIHQRLVPIIRQGPDGELQATWSPWLLDESEQPRFEQLIEVMPPIVRAGADEQEGDGRRILSSALVRVVDATVRRTLIEQHFGEALEEWETSDPHVAWLHGLLDAPRAIPVAPHELDRFQRNVGTWLHRLDDGRQSDLCLGLRLEEPVDLVSSDMLVPDDSVRWKLRFELRSSREASIRIDAAEVWRHGAGLGALPQHGVTPEELLLTQLARAARVYPLLEKALAEAAPTVIELTTLEAHQLLREHRSLLEEAGVIVEVPAWWGAPASRLGIQMRLDTPNVNAVSADDGDTAAASKRHIGLDALVRFDWSIAVGDQTLSREMMDHLAQRATPLVRLGGRWVEIGAEELRSATELIESEPGKEVTLLQALQIASGTSAAAPPLPVSSLEASGWVRGLLDPSQDDVRFQRIRQPESFRGELRPYQEIGLSWLAFLDRVGLGACLADDMGLGKTIQLIALLLHERAHHKEVVGPTLLIVPTSLISNWSRELSRFAPSMSVHVQHGPQRPDGSDFADTARTHDVVITTYGLVSRDIESLRQVPWWRVVLDEAQSIKNPPTKQASAIRSLPAARRIALTGTPVENRLAELWSIMEFCTPGLLGSASDFRRRFSVPIERHRDQEQSDRLRRFIRPFVLRRLKTDPTVIDDLPACVETREFANLTPEQGALYQQVVAEMMARVDASEGMRRRGLVLSTLVRLKQICNHPAHFLLPKRNGGKAAPAADVLPIPARSGKCRRLIEMLEEICATGDKALVFTQFRQMGHLLAAMIQHELDREVLFLHGGTPQGKRQQMIDQFQAAGADIPVFILSLKAGGVGVNLTAANHVFHFDRWWNPAVEKQATDRAFRIGQTRTVHVHKFVCVGTLEERIDQMIEQKTALAEHIVGSGERWLTELSSGQLRDLLALDASALEDEG